MTPLALPVRPDRDPVDRTRWRLLDARDRPVTDAYVRPASIRPSGWSSFGNERTASEAADRLNADAAPAQGSLL